MRESIRRALNAECRFDLRKMAIRPTLGVGNLQESVDQMWAFLIKQPLGMTRQQLWLAVINAGLRSGGTRMEDSATFNRCCRRMVCVLNDPTRVAPVRASRPIKATIPPQPIEAVTRASVENFSSLLNQLHQTETIFDN